MTENEDINNGPRDEEILAESVGNPALFAVIFKRYEEPFRRKVRHILGEKDEVDDILQETFTRIYLNANRFKKVEGATFKSWAYKILINVTFTYYQKLKKTAGVVDILDDELREIIPDLSADDLGKKELRDVVARAISRIPDRMGESLTKHFLEDKPEQQIADEEGTSLGAIKTRIHRAKKALKKELLKNNA